MDAYKSERYIWRGTNITLVSKHTIYIDDGYGRSDKWVFEVRRVGNTYDIFVTRNGRNQIFKDEYTERPTVKCDKK